MYTQEGSNSCSSVRIRRSNKVTHRHKNETYTGLACDGNIGWYYVGNDTIDYGVSDLYADVKYGSHTVVNGKGTDM